MVLDDGTCNKANTADRYLPEVILFDCENERVLDMLPALELDMGVTQSPVQTKVASVRNVRDLATLSDDLTQLEKFSQELKTGDDILSTLTAISNASAGFGPLVDERDKFLQSLSQRQNVATIRD